MKNNRIYSLVILMIFIFQSSILTAEISAESNNQLNISENLAYAWKFSESQNDLRKKFIEEEHFKLPTEKESLVGFEFRWEIWEIDDKTNYYEISYALCEGTKEGIRRLSARCDSGYTAHIGKDPVLVGQEMFKETSNYSFSILFIPHDVESYLERFIEGLPESNKSLFTAQGNTLRYKHEVSDGTYEMLINYNDQGIQSNFSLCFNGVPFYEYHYVGTYTETTEPTPFTSLSMIIVFIFIPFIFFLYLRLRYGKKDKNLKEKQRNLPSFQVQPAMQNNKTCSNCGKDIEETAKFCEYCGKKTAK